MTKITVQDNSQAYQVKLFWLLAERPGIFGVAAWEAVK